MEVASRNVVPAFGPQPRAIDLAHSRRGQLPGRQGGTVQKQRPLGQNRRRKALSAPAISSASVLKLEDNVACLDKALVPTFHSLNGDVNLLLPRVNKCR